MEQLRDIVGLLEKKEVIIDDLAIKVKDAKKLVDFCRNKLQETEDEITKIINPEELDSEGL